MDTISTYLENMFAGLPATEEIARIKADLQATMEDKYNELKWEGKSENEAIGIVISEFGNIDELKSELGLLSEDRPEENTPKARKISLSEVEHFLADRKKYHFLISLGVFLCIAAPAMLLLFNALVPSIEVLGLIALFIMAGIAVGLFILSGISLEKYSYFKEEFEIDSTTKSMVAFKNEAFQPTFIMSIVIGVMLCIFSPIPVIALDALSTSEAGASLGVVILLLMVASAVFMFVYFGTSRESYHILLQTGDYEKTKKNLEARCEPADDLFASIYWPIMVIIYLTWSFTTHDWHISWIIWPIAGIAFGIIEKILKYVKASK